jgi:hypothetical protein
VVDAQWLLDDVADGHPCVQHRRRVLEDHLQTAALLAQLALGHRGEVEAVEPHPSRRRRDQPEDRQRRRGLARPRLADQAERLARAQREADVVYRAHRADRPAQQLRPDREVDPEVLDLEQRGVGRLVHGASPDPVADGLSGWASRSAK